MKLFHPSAEDRILFTKVNFKSPALWTATWFGAGFFRPAPGTWGSLAALPFGLVIRGGLGPCGLFAAIVIIFIAGLWSAREFSRQTGTEDHKTIVIDEVCGQWIALIPAALNPYHVLAAFILFRAFDVFKPWPVSWAEQKLPGAWGVMMDDVIAGIFAALCIVGWQHVRFG